MLIVSFTRACWLNKLKPAGCLTKADRLEGPMAPIVTTGYNWRKKEHFSRVVLVLGAMLIFAVSCVSSLCRDHAISVEKTLHFSDSSSLCRDHADLQCITSVEEKLDGFLRYVRTFGRAVEGRTEISQPTCASANDANSVLVHHELFMDSCRRIATHSF